MQFRLLSFILSVGFIIVPLISTAQDSIPSNVPGMEYWDPMANQCSSLYDEPQPGVVKKTGFSGWLDNTWSWCKQNNVADHLDAGISLSTMGIGLEVKTPVTKWVDLRLGVDWMPRFNVNMDFDLATFSDGLPTGNFSHVQDMVYKMTGIEMDESVMMNGHASMVNFKFIVDVYPIPNNRHWRVSAGFYAGTSQIAKAINDYDEKPTLVGLNIYNRAYEYFTHLESIYDVPLGGGTYMNPETVVKLQERFNTYGHMGIHIGNFKDGTPYLMEPAPDGTISARAVVNHFKPYLGIGYSTDLDAMGKWHLGVDLGALFWGAPKVLNYDYSTGREINFVKDLTDIRGKVKDYINIVKALPVYPVLSVRVSYSFF